MHAHYSPPTAGGQVDRLPQPWGEHRGLCGFGRSQLTHALSGDGSRMGQCSGMTPDGHSDRLPRAILRA